MNPSDQHDTSPQMLVQACLRGDATAWEQLLERYMRLVYAVGVRHGLYEREVEDMAQETFAALALSLSALHDADALPAWLITTARRLCWRSVQRRRREDVAAFADLADVPLEKGAAPLYASMPSMEEMSAEWQRQDALAHGLARLGDRCRTLLTMLFLDTAELSYDEISARTGIAKGSIGPKRLRCLQQLRSILEGLGVVDSSG